jgi:WD40 repeat protein
VLAVDSCGAEPSSSDLVGHSDAVRSVRFSQGGDRLVTASLDGTARVWDPSGREIAVLSEHRNRVYFADFGVADRFLLTASRDGAVRVWENPVFGAGRRPRAVLVYGAELGGVPHAAFSPDGRFIAAAYWRNAAAVWRLLEPAGRAAAEPSGRRAAWGNSLEDLALIEDAWRFRQENRLDELFGIPASPATSP